MKRYASEDGSDQVRLLTELVVSSLARVEVPAAIWGKHRGGELGAETAATLVAEFEWEWHEGDAFVIVASVAEVLGEAARVTARHPLRAYDAVQLASALAARTADPLLTFGCFDDRLRRAALLEGFELAFESAR